MANVYCKCFSCGRPFKISGPAVGKTGISCPLCGRTAYQRLQKKEYDQLKGKKTDRDLKQMSLTE